jgi:hypothetical protein
MKKIILILLVLTSFSFQKTEAKSVLSENIKDSFLQDVVKKMKACKKEQYDNLQKPEYHTNDAMIGQTTKLSYCYENLIMEIHKKYYPQRSEKLKTYLENFYDSAYHLYIETYKDDRCAKNNNCGSLIPLLTFSNMGEFMEDYLIFLINEAND